jgi:hypothetical protein
MTDHQLVIEESDGREVVRGCVRVVCACGFQGVWMTRTLPDAEGVERPATEYAAELIEILKYDHPSEPPPDAQEALYQKVLARLRDEGHIT